MALHRLSVLFLFATAAAAETPEECVAEGLCPTPGIALLQTASQNIARHGAASQGVESEAVVQVDLRTAANYVILAKTGISTVPSSSITGNISVSPIAGTAMTGFNFDKSSPEFWTSSQITGFALSATHSSPVPAILLTAISDMETAYADASQRTNTEGYNIGAGNLGGLTLTTGVYTFNTDINIGVDITFSGGADDVFILQTTGALKQATSTKVILAGGAQAKNIFWQVAGNVWVGAGSVMQGILLVKTDVAFVTGSSLTGRIYAQTACTLQMATITQPV